MADRGVSNSVSIKGGVHGDFNYIAQVFPRQIMDVLLKFPEVALALEDCLKGVDAERLANIASSMEGAAANLSDLDLHSFSRAAFGMQDIGLYGFDTAVTRLHDIPVREFIDAIDKLGPAMERNLRALGDAHEELESTAAATAAAARELREVDSLALSTSYQFQIDKMRKEWGVTLRGAQSEILFWQKAAGFAAAIGGMLLLALLI